MDREELVKIHVKMAFRFRARQGGRGRGREYATVEELRELIKRIAAMERHGICPKEVSDDEEEEPQGDVNPIRLFKLVLEASSRPWSKVLTYDGSLIAK